MAIVVILAVVVLCTYIVLISLGISSWIFAKQKGVGSSTHRCSEHISLIIPFRNEQQVLPTLLDHLDSQDLDTTLWTCYFVDDHSDDAGPELIAGRLKSNYILLSAVGTGKKNAIKTAIDLITSTWVVQTDADCTMGTGWIAATHAAIREGTKIFSAAPVMISQPVSLLDHFQAIELMALMGMTQTGLERGWWYMANGANMMYTRDLAVRHYQSQDIQSYASGDDMSLVYAAAKDPDQTLLFNLRPQSIVFTPASRDRMTLINQRLRWGTKNFGSKDIVLKCALAIAITGNAMMIPALIIPIFFPQFISMTLIYWLSKWSIDYLYIRVLSPFYHYRVSLSKFLISGFLYPFYITFIFILSIFKKNYEWKGRITR